MTPKRSRRVSVPRSRSGQYADVADNFHRGAELAKEFEYWNAAGVLIVHAAIAYADAVTIKFGGVKSRGEDHMAAGDLVRRVVALDAEGRKAMNHFSSMIREKNIVSYSGEVYRRKDIERLWKHLVRFRRWALDML